MDLSDFPLTVDDIPTGTVDQAALFTAFAVPLNLLASLMLDSGWVNLTPAAGSGTLRCRRGVGSLAVVEAVLGGLSVAAGSALTIVAAGGIPSSSRPAVAAWVTAGRWGGPGSGVNPAAAVLVGTDGSILVENRTGVTGTAVHFRLPYLVG